MYLFHHCFVYIYGRMLTGVDWPIGIEFAVLTIVSAATVIAIHEGLVRRFATIRLLFNGKTDVAQVRKQPGLIGAFFPNAANMAAKNATKPRQSTQLSPKL